ncbi:uncharacterized protein LOC131687047 [Topomyia yanbarensis]|uniref:uncharacterized protein LOC131687047 n=1 Tax=Topomyia yanbarensis TaxID=2498891 RepID=UPI00273C128F|nr:uncharacterized protein LOC131687047 [Topomyia yanbarensis]
MVKIFNDQLLVVTKKMKSKKAFGPDGIPNVALKTAILVLPDMFSIVLLKTETSEIATWRWVGTKQNVADEATKWQRLPDLGNDSRWFRSLEFLWQERNNWPVEPFTTGTTKEEIRSHLFHHRVVMKPCINAEYFSNWKRLVGTVGFVFRFLGNCRSKVTGIQRNLGPPSSMELQQASNYLFREAQRESFPEEVAILLNRNATTKALPKQSAIYTMKPFLDENQLMRMFGRISRCEYATMDAQNPVVLPKNHHITKLLVRDYHERFHHCNHETVINELRQKFRIPKQRVAYRNVRANCQKCKNQRAISQPPPMGDLSKVRLAAFYRPFTFVGVDYFGPIMVALGRRSEKRWGLLVTCLTTRAVYIEVAHTLNADSCVMAIRNFMVRRGVPNQIFSDRGTNFTAANKELGATLAELDQDKIVQEIVGPNTEWCFIPPASSHMGGSWERLIQSVKRNLEQIRPRCYLSDEALRNQLIEIEGTINSRPLTHVPADDPDAPVLTPNHFILGSSSDLKPAALLDDSALALKRSWRNSQVEANIFWRRWVRDYMPNLTRHTKWFSEIKAIEVGDIVVIVDPDHPRNCWPKGRIISVNRGKDGKVRSAAVQTAIRGVYERPVVKLAVLDVRRDEQVSHNCGVPGGSVTTPRSARLTFWSNTMDVATSHVESYMTDYRAVTTVTYQQTMTGNINY